MMSPSLQITDPAVARAAEAAKRVAGLLASQQNADGYWCAPLTADTTLESDWVLLQLWLSPPDSDGQWKPANKAQIDKAARSILERQLPDGGFNIYPQGPSDVSASVKAYFALKLAGIESSRLQALRERILALGGLQAANSYTKINLSLFGLYPRCATPAIPPEMILCGNLIYHMSSWSRAILMPLAIVYGADTHRPAPTGFTLKEIQAPGVPVCLKRDRTFTWHNFFLGVDSLIRWWEKHGLRKLRKKAIAKAEAWMLERMDHAEGLGAIYPPMMYSIMAMDVLGYKPDDPRRIEALRQFDKLRVEDRETFYFQPCFSAIWDTAISAFALGEADAATVDLNRRAGDWILANEVRRRGDWSLKRPDLEPSGWAFEFKNEHYPDIDDTGMVLLALMHARGSDVPKWQATVDRAINWLIGMQSKDGGWAAFDVDNNWKILSQVPFADHNAMLDPTCADISGRVIEALIRAGVSRDHPAIRRGVEYLIRTQESDGSWFGRWGVNYLYGTCFALRGLRAAGESDREAYILRAAEWIRSIQNSDDGWGESCSSYDNATFAPGISTPSQTAWAILGLIAAGDWTSGSLHQGVEYLCETQDPSTGEWSEKVATGTGFPKVFYLSYHLYRNAFPLLALTDYRKSQTELHQS
ncbi:MAG TPA: squalene--hopene cyclase [Bryobacteraceae bacterium]|jgi:squalene-hopene/tetraprenyl-beta-curcumene cyclase